MKTKLAQSVNLSFEDLVAGARQLKAADRLRLIEQVLPGIDKSGSPGSGSDRSLAVAYLVKAMHALVADQPVPKRSFYGLCADLGPAPSAEVIDAARSEVWADFPRSDI